MMRRHMRRILSLKGWDVSTGVPGTNDWVGIWGQSPTAWRGEAVAEWADAPILSVEDSFLRSVHPGRVRNELPLGLCLDESGVHFDAGSPSDIETLLRTNGLDETQLLNRAKRAIEQIKYWHLGKYSAYDLSIDVPPPGYVLVIDQTRGDAALQGAGAADFAEMLVAAADEHPGAEILIKTHPETKAGKRPGHFDKKLPVDRARLFDAPASPWTLFEGALGVYTHSSTLGFEAIFADHKPRVFGQPFYAGWGLTTDEDSPSRRQRTLTRAQLFAAAMIHYPTWYDPVKDRLCEVEDVIAALAARSRAWREDHQGYVGLGMRRWKRGFLRRAFGRDRRLVFSATQDRATKRAKREDRQILAWGQTPAPMESICIEDGFLRSRGLGAALVPPLSLVADRSGIYYDPSKPSDLDQLISRSNKLPLAEIERSERLIAEICRLDLTKYNQNGDCPSIPNDRRRILVVGQVEDDASVVLGASEVKTNADLLAIARAENKQDCILWKPHPDVEAGLRAGVVKPSIVSEFADITLDNVSAATAISNCDEVWTITSTLGFEALLRAIPVVCAGVPFYAGWGLTRDLSPQPAHRIAKVTLEGLAHACLIGYPRYFDPDSGIALSPEQAIARLVAQASAPNTTSHLTGIQRLYQLMRRLSR
ncbi:MAG: capsular polysaccharide biosynthesis protein [Boseongicola sp.]